MVLSSKVYAICCVTVCLVKKELQLTEDLNNGRSCIFHTFRLNLWVADTNSSKKKINHTLLKTIPQSVGNVWRSTKNVFLILLTESWRLVWQSCQLLPKWWQNFISSDIHHPASFAHQQIKQHPGRHGVPVPWEACGFHVHAEQLFVVRLQC